MGNRFMPELLQMVSKQLQQSSRDQQLLTEMTQATVSQRMEKQRGVLEIEQRRLATIDEAERPARVEVKELAERRREDEIREQREKDALLEWEAFVPAKPVPQEPEEFEVVEVKPEEKLIVLQNENVVAISPDWTDEQIAELAAAMSQENLEGVKRILATVAPGPDEGSSVLKAFRITDPGGTEDSNEASADA